MVAAVEDPSAPKEPSRARLKYSQAVTKILLESASLSNQWINRPDNFIQSKCEAIVRIIEALTDYVPKRRMNKEGGTPPPECNAATMTRHANKNKSTVFRNFFDKDEIHGICSRYALHFVDRYTNPYTVRILGDVVPSHQSHGGCLIVSNLDETKMDKIHKRTGHDWSREGTRTGIPQEAARKRLVDIKKDPKERESLQEEDRQRWMKAEQDRYELSVHERNLSKVRRQQRASEKKVKAPRTAQQQQAYQDLSHARRLPSGI
ncbi:hypothetical protein BGZ96_011423 [Linnemannia gamsii]|uniref:Uncharacterized protein n=1 Tax=Linnemannia gamsii TaxID=64522 RepID=A0ABQ7KC94_9FUNG|nr:hypothetical protein BGZ96_011423 [Linnemannia gamsii]